MKTALSLFIIACGAALAFCATLALTTFPESEMVMSHLSERVIVMGATCIIGHLSMWLSALVLIVDER